MPQARSGVARLRRGALAALALLVVATLAALVPTSGRAAARASSRGAVAALVPTSGRAAARASSRGAVATLFAGSLVDYMEHDFGPSFEKASGYGFEGFGGGSTELANEIKGGVRRGDVFVSAAAAADEALKGSANGSWVSWYSSFMASPLVLAYDPQSPFGRQLASGKPWYQVLAEPGIRVGRTDPTLDPKGVLTAEAIAAAAHKLHDPALASAESHFETFPETALVGRMQAGQLDAGFFYSVEAKTAKLSTVPLTPVYKYAEYTVTILNHASNPSGSAALIRYLLNKARTYTLSRNGLNPTRPKFAGSRAAVPASLRITVGARR
jgi:molybdate/tungstate transport system substrate-binding protein